MASTQTGFFFFPALLIGLAASTQILIGCGNNSTTKASRVVVECILPTDQSNTLAGRWTGKPIPVAFQKDHFTSNEKAEMVAAFDTWNKFFDSSRGYSILDYGGNPEAPREISSSKPASLCAQRMISTTNKFTGYVMIYKVKDWAASASAMALTTFCPESGTPFKKITNAYMEINYRDYFISGKRLPDLQSIMLHELGHLLGLWHSCEYEAKGDGQPNCGDTKLMKNEYVEAVMYPTFNFPDDTTGEQKRLLRANDQGRTNCLYDPIEEK